MPKKKGGASSAAKKSLSERQNVPPGTKKPQDVRTPPSELTDSMALLEERA